MSDRTNWHVAWQLKRKRHKARTMRRAQRALTERRRAKEAGIILGRHDYPLAKAV